MNINKKGSKLYGTFNDLINCDVMYLCPKDELTFSQDWQDSKKMARTKRSLSTSIVEDFILFIFEKDSCLSPIYMLNWWEIPHRLDSPNFLFLSFFFNLAYKFF